MVVVVLVGAVKRLRRCAHPPENQSGATEKATQVRRTVLAWLDRTLHVMAGSPRQAPRDLGQAPENRQNPRPSNGHPTLD